MVLLGTEDTSAICAPRPFCEFETRVNHVGAREKLQLRGNDATDLPKLQCGRGFFLLVLGKTNSLTLQYHTLNNTLAPTDIVS